MFYKDFKQFKNMLIQEAMHCNPWDGEEYIYSFLWNIENNLTLYYNFFETESKLEEDYRIEIVVTAGHSVFAYRNSDTVFVGTYGELTYDASPVNIISAYLAKVKTLDVVPYSVKRLVLGVYDKAYGDGYNFNNFRDYVKNKKDYHPVNFNYVLGEHTFNELKFSVRAQLFCHKKYISVEFFINYFDTKINEWSTEQVGMLSNDSTPYDFFYESVSIWEFLYLALPNDKWYGERIAQVKSLITNNFEK